MSKKMKIAMPDGGLLDAATMGEEKDVPVDPHQVVSVPEAYGRSLIENRFAYAAQGDVTKGKTRSSGKSKTVEPDTGAAPVVPGGEAGGDEQPADDGEDDEDGDDGSQGDGEG